MENWLAELAAASRSAGTRSGMVALTAGMKKARTTPSSTATAKSRPRRSCVSPLQARMAKPSARTPRPAMTSQTTMIRTRDQRSARAPPNGASTTPGSDEMVISRPMRLAEPVVSMVQNIIATRKASLPSWLTVCPCQSSTKLRFHSRVAGTGRTCAGVISIVVSRQAGEPCRTSRRAVRPMGATGGSAGSARGCRRAARPGER